MTEMQIFYRYLDSYKNSRRDFFEKHFFLTKRVQANTDDHKQKKSCSGTAIFFVHCYIKTFPRANFHDLKTFHG